MATGITINEGRATCDDCGRWEWASSGKAIRHSTRCDTPGAQLNAAPAQAEPRKDILGKYSQALAVRRFYLRLRAAYMPQSRKSARNARRFATKCASAAKYP